MEGLPLSLLLLVAVEHLGVEAGLVHLSLGAPDPWVRVALLLLGRHLAG